MRTPCATAYLLLATSSVIGCPLQAVEEKLSEADDYLYWHEIWDQSDTPSATFELDNAIAVTKQATSLLDGADCAATRIGRNVQRIAQGRLRGLTQQRDVILSRNRQAAVTGQ